jgi:putative hydrolase of the HAD superfamily
VANFLTSNRNEMMPAARVVAVGFDLGETLLGYGDVPLSWQSHYRAALERVADVCGLQASDARLDAGERILTRFNTRVHPRTTETTSSEVFGAILNAWQLPVSEHLLSAEEAFFAFFQRSCSPYADTIATLRQLRERRLPIGILTDVPYGMPTRLVERDVAHLDGLIDALVTSVDVGHRKPAPQGYLTLLERLSVEDPDRCLFVGNELKDIEGANEAGLVSVLIDRGRSGMSCGQQYSIESLTELSEIIDRH